MISRIILLGPPASGKGTQAAMLARKLRIASASTGAILRNERKKGTALGSEVAALTSEGKLFSDEIAMRVVGSWLDQGHWNAFILDGFPRTLGQATAFDAELSARDLDLEAAIHLTLDPATIFARVASRMTCGTCGATFSQNQGDLNSDSPCTKCGGALERRKDDTEDVLAKRLSQHESLSAPVVDHYRRRGLLLEVDASPESGAVFAAVVSALEQGVLK